MFIRFVFYYLILSFALFTNVNSAESGGMPQLNPEFWISQIFWLTLSFGFLFIILSKFILPKISSNLELRKSQILENIETAEKQKKESENDLLSSIINAEVSWLLKTETRNENYFRLNKNSFQQGEMIKITGTQPFDNPAFNNLISFNITKDNEKIYNGDVDYNYEKDRWEGNFRASTPGSYLYKLFIDNSDDPIQVGKFKVLESQIELTQVYLNQELLNKISEHTNGDYYHWDDRNELEKIISPKVRRELKAEIIKLTESRLVLIILIFILCIEWTIRRFKGLV